MGMTKTCRGPCGRELPLDGDHFHGNGRNEDGTPRYRAWCRTCRVQGKHSYDPPPLEAVPDGFDVRRVSTLVDPTGTIEKQWLESAQATETAPLIPPLPPGHIVKGVSTLLDGAGNIRAQWQKTSIELQEKAKREQWLLDAIMKMGEAWPSRGPTALEKPSDDDLMCVIPMGDPHFGMYAWAAETGDDYDLKLAEEYHCTAMDSLVASAPAAGRGLLIDLGDFFHMDNSSNQTLRGHHQLDVDTRWPKVIKSGVAAMVWLVKRMLQKFGTTDVWCVPGNHDPHSAFMMQLALSIYFKDEPRVRIADVAGLFYYLRFGENLIGSTHTHTIKDRASLGETMAADRKEDWGCTTHRYWYCGHVHHDSLIETKGGTIVETHRTLAGKDKFAAESGYRSGRDMKCDVFHLEQGRIQRNVIGIRQIMKQLKEKNR